MNGIGLGTDAVHVTQKPLTLIEKLRADGFKVRVTHYRNYPRFGELLTRTEFEQKSEWWPTRYANEVSPMGGLTTVRLTSPDGYEYEEFAECHNIDCFNRKKGLKIALNRVLKYFDQAKKDLENIRQMVSEPEVEKVGFIQKLKGLIG